MKALTAALLSEAAYRSERQIDKLCLYLGFRDVAHFDVADTQAFMASNGKEVAIFFRGTEFPTAKEMLKSIRGHSNRGPWGLLKDLRTDTKFKKTKGPFGMVHRGFFWALANVRAQIVDALHDKCYLGQKVVLGGHSLGAGLATIMAASLRADGLPASELITFGSPRVGDRRFAASFSDIRVRRFTNNNDIVTRVPIFNYWHVGDRQHFSLCGNFHEAPSWWFLEMDRLAGRIKNPWSDGMNDHGMENYVRLTRNYNATGILDAIGRGDTGDSHTAGPLVNAAS